MHCHGPIILNVPLGPSAPDLLAQIDSVLDTPATILLAMACIVDLPVAP